MSHTSSYQNLNHSTFECFNVSKVFSKIAGRIVLWLSFLLIGILLIPVGILMLLISGVVCSADFVLTQLEKGNDN